MGHALGKAIKDTETVWTQGREGAGTKRSPSPQRQQLALRDRDSYPPPPSQKHRTGKTDKRQKSDSRKEQRQG